jgi:S1-C subfamily serine protease
MPAAAEPVQGETKPGGHQRMDMIEQFSSALADRIAAAAGFVVAVRTGGRPTSGILWRPDVVVASEQMLPQDAAALQVVHGGRSIGATLAGRDPGTNVAVLRLETALDSTPNGGVPMGVPVGVPVGVPAGVPQEAEAVRVGNLALLVGADAAGAATGRLGMVHALGDAWHSMAGGRIDALIRLDARLGMDEGGPVLSLAGGLIGMSTSGPRRRTIVIPTATLMRVIDPLLTDGRIARAWLGIGLQPVMIPDSFRSSTGRDSGLMVVSLAGAGPAETAGILPGDVVLDIDGSAVSRPRALSALLGADRIGQVALLRVLRAGAVQAISVTIAARPAA